MFCYFLLELGNLELLFYSNNSNPFMKEAVMKGFRKIYLYTRRLFSQTL